MFLVTGMSENRVRENVGGTKTGTTTPSALKAVMGTTMVALSMS